MLITRVKILAALFFLLGLGIYLYKINLAPALVWDEQFHVPAAKSYLQGDKDHYFNLRNPPLGKEIIAASILIFGDQVWAYRLPSALAGAGLVALIFILGFQVTGRTTGGLLAAGLWFTSTLAYIHARLATLDMMTTFFFIAGLAAFLQIFFRNAKPLRWLLFACLLAGIGASIKVLCLLLFPLFFLGLYLHRSSWPLRNSLPPLFLGAILFPIASLAISYGILGFGPLDVIFQLRKMTELQSTLHRNIPQLSSWYEWFLFKGSHWYHSALMTSGQHFSIWCSNNPVLWTFGALSLFPTFYWGWKQNNPPYLLLAAGVPLQILFWTIFKKQTILYYGLPLEPFFCLTIALTLKELTRLAKNPALALGLWSGCLLAASGYYFIRELPQAMGFVH